MDYKLQFTINKLVEKGVNKANSLRKTRKLLTNYIFDYLEKGYNIYFITFTFKDQYLPFNRKQFVDYLRRSNNCGFILYADYGSKTNRFHLHGICVSNEKLKVTKQDYFNKFGHVKVKNIKSDLTKYIVKYSVKFNKPSFRLIHTKPKISV